MVALHGMYSAAYMICVWSLTVFASKKSFHAHMNTVQVFVYA